MAFVPTPSPTVVDQTTLMKKYLQFVAALTDNNTPDETKLKMMQEVSENFENVTSSPQYSTFLEHIIPRFLTFLQDGEVQFLQEKPAQQLRKLVLEIIHRIPTNEHLRPHTKNILSVMFRFLETESEENVLICLRIIIELHKQFRPPITQEIHHFLEFVKQIYKELPKVVNRYFENPQVVPENTVPSPEMVGMITSVVVKTNPEREDSETRTHTIIPRGSLSLKVLAELPIIVVLMYQLYKLNIHNVVAEFVPLIMNTIMLQVSSQARQHKLYNKELYADFIAAQIKTLSFLAYIIRIYQDLVAKYSQQMVKGMLQLLSNCPSETAHLRKELLIAAKHILTTDLRSQFIPCMDKLFDESILIGQGYTARETLRPLAYSTLADLVHHVRQNLPLNDLSLAVQLFAKNIDDESLPSSIQTMSCKLLLNLVDCIRSKSEQENGNGRDVLMRMLEVFVLKFHTIARYQLVTIFKKCKPQSELGVVDAGALPGVPATPTAPVPLPTPAPPVVASPAANSFEKPGDKEKEDKQTFQVSDCRSLVKTLVCGVKTITWGITSCKAPGEAQFIPNKQLQPKETQIYIKLVKYAMQALDIYQVQIAGNGQTYIRVANCQTVRMKEEKEVLEHFAGVFTMMNPLTFKEIFQTTVPYMVERISKNYALQIVANSFLANPSTSALFATILVEYLLERLPEMGSNIELSNLYLKLFKLVFGSVSLFAAENEQMLKPHLHKIVNSSMELAQSAKEPYNYFLLLRALFRSIGGGSHDLLYQEFLPLLPNLLQGLNMLQSGLHKQHMKDLFVELCLTVPVRLSSLLPYLPMLMDPLVSALNGSQTLVSQGLRTLELCVDNLQPDFLYDHIQPVRAELMQALWRTLRNPADTISHVAYRVLGKFGGSNRKMLKESQKLQYVMTEVQGPSTTIEFSDCKASVQLPMEKAIETALDCLKSANTEPYYRRQAWEVIKCFLVAMMSLEDNKHALYQLLAHPNFTEKWIPNVIISHRYKAQDTPARKTFEQALTGAFMSAVIKDLRPSALPFVASLIRHFTMVAVAQQCGPFLLQCYQSSSQPSTAMFHSEENGSKGMDPLVLIDAIAICMAYEEKELCKIGEVALAVIFDVASIILGSKERACQLPLFSYIVERLCACCYEQAWYAKLGGVVSIKFLMERLPLIWVLQNQQTFLKALLFVMMDLTGEVSNGAVAMSKTTLEQLLVRCATPLKEEEKSDELLAAQEKSFHHVTHDLVREVTSPNSTVRKQAMHSLQVLAQVTGKSVTVIMEPHKEVLQDMVPPKKHLLRHQPANAQIGLMEGNTFCTTLQPRLFTMDLNVVEHKVFYTELLNLCEAEDAALMKLPCYKSLPSLVPLRIAALNALAACNYLPQSREKIIAALFKALNSTNNELQEAGEACMRKFLEGATIEVDQIHTHMRPLLMMLGDYRSLTLNVVNRLTSVTRLFPNSFNDKFCDQMMQHLRKWMEVVVITHKGGQRSDGSPVLEGVEEMRICSAIINLFHLIPAAPQTLVKPLLEVVMKTERAMLIEAGSPFREPLIKFLTRHPSQTVELFMMEATLNDPQWSRMFMSFLKHKDAKPLRDVLASNPNRFVTLLLPPGPQATVRPGSPSTSSNAMRLDLQFQAIKIISIIVKHDPGWLAGQHSLVSQLRRVWVSEAFQERHRKENMSATNWKEPKLLAYCLLSYCKRNYSEIELLFQLLRAFTGRFLCNMTFLKDYMEEEIPKNYSITHKRALFFRFVEFNDPNFGDELKAKVLQHILNPAFLYSFEKAEGEQLLGPPNPEGDNPESITSVFITKVLDPEKQADLLDSLRIYLLQFATLLVEHAPHHIHDNNKSRNSKLRRLMTFAWPCLLPKACVDPACKYSGHLLLAHIIAKFAIHKKIVLQVFHSLLKAHNMEARAIVRQAMAILTPAVPARMEDGHQMLTHWTRKIIVEEGHTVPQLVHILHLIVQHFRVYYPVRHHLVQHMVSAMQRLGFTPSVTIEQRKLAVDLAEVVIKWELQRIKDQLPESEGDSCGEGTSSTTGAVKRGLSMDSGQDVKRFRTATGAVSTVFARSQSTPGADALLGKPVEKQHTDTVVNFLIRIACQVNDSASTAGSPGELLSRRCVTLMKTALRPDMWPKSELKLQWFDKLLMTVEQQNQTNFANICTGLEVLSFLLTVLPSTAILAHFKPLQRGIAACMSCGNTKVLRAVHTLLSRLMSIFPTEPSTSNVASKYEELECLYAAVGKVIYEGLTNYEKATNANSSQLFGTLMILKSACSNNPSYIDRLISVFMRSLQKMVRDHLNTQTTPGAAEASTVTSELVMLSLDLVKTRLSVMSPDMRKNFIQVILTSLIEKSPDPKILRAVVKIVEEWVKNNSPMAANQMPNLREKSILLVKMMSCIEKRFPEDLELNAQYLDLVNYVYRDETLSGSDITSKLEPAFLSGLRCPQPLIRAKFFEVFDGSIKRRVYERLLYITCSQNWEAMGNHFWIKQCVELLLAVCERGTTIGTSCQGAMLPSITNVINLADSHERAAFAMVTHVKQEPRERENSETKEEDVEIDVELAPGDQSNTLKTKEQAEKDTGNQLHMLTNKHDKFLDSLREVKTGTLLNAFVQLCHISTPLAEKTWIQLFPRLWKILSDRQQHGDYLENIFVKDRQLHLGVSAITCYLHACRHQNESKSRKYLAKVLWLLSFDDKNTLADAVDKYCIGVPPLQWLAWIPQLLTCLVGSEGKPLLNLISQVGRVFPQAVYFPIRTLYLTLKIEQRERYKSDSGQQQPTSVGVQAHSASDPGPIRATAPMWRCSRIMHMQRELHPTLLSSLEGIVDQMVWFRENWHEEVLRQLQQGLAKCYSVAFEKSGAVSDARITTHTMNFVKKLVSTFGVGLENVSNVSTMFSSAASESLARRAQATAQDPVFQKMKSQFTTDFDFSVPGSMKLHNLISKLKKWIKILEAKTKQLPKFFLIEEKCRFLSNFSAQTAEVEIPGEFLMPKPTHYYIKIARFMPRVEIVQKHNTAARRLYIRGHNGKIYPYLVMNDACLTESRREERVLQLLRLLNPCLEKRKETTKRHLFFTVPRVVAVSPQMRLVEDNPSSLSLVEIYKQRCTKKGIEHDNPISRYYDRLATVQARGAQASHQVLRDVLKEVQSNMVPRSMLKEWALHTFPNATDYWTFRKMFTVQLAHIGLAEFVFHLNRLNPEMLQIAQDTGRLNVAYFRFDINDATGDLDANRPVPFRLTPNISEFLTTIGVSGPLTASMIAVARCFAQPNFKVDGILKAVLRDEIIAWHKKTQEDTSTPLSAAGQPENMDSQQLVSLVQKSVTAIMTRLHSLAQFEGGESKVNTLVAAANSLDNLCRMDPAWHPWL
ncbi:transformation/transcription domain-associated protein [Polypterus senegalus]|uniref:transformation/transcription domain-associated protein n=1 Tax=Polypterus senegalus TaxID=55291 RepID=UPI0019666AB2|nr:transformation/transcription domain-associated protein [Polypterus senegalus]